MMSAQIIGQGRLIRLRLWLTRRRNRTGAWLSRLWCSRVLAHGRKGHVRLSLSHHYVECDLCGARFRSLIEAGAIEESGVAPRLARRLELEERRAQREGTVSRFPVGWRKG